MCEIVGNNFVPWRRVGDLGEPSHAICPPGMGGMCEIVWNNLVPWRGADSAHPWAEPFGRADARPSLFQTNLSPANRDILVLLVASE